MAPLRRRVGTLLGSRAASLEGGCLNGRVAQGPLAYVRDLERRDQAIAAALETLGSLRGRTRALGAEAARLAAVLKQLPREQAAAASAIERGEVAVERRRDELAEAEEAAAHARRDREGRERAVELARAVLLRAEEELVSARGRAEALAGAQTTAEREAAAVVAAAAAVARELEDAPRLSSRVPAPPEAGLAGVTDWASRADGALLLARSGLDDEREAVVREATELAAVVLGEPAAPAGVHRIRERVEAAIEH
jgi:hypothetical protein